MAAYVAVTHKGHIQAVWVAYKPPTTKKHHLVSLLIEQFTNETESRTEMKQRFFVSVSVNNNLNIQEGATLGDPKSRNDGTAESRNGGKSP